MKQLLVSNQCSIDEQFKNDNKLKIEGTALDAAIQYDHSEMERLPRQHGAHTSTELKLQAAKKISETKQNSSADAKRKAQDSVFLENMAQSHLTMFPLPHNTSQAKKQKVSVDPNKKSDVSKQEPAKDNFAFIK